MSKKMLFLAITMLAVLPAGRAAADADDDRIAAQRIAQDLRDSGQLQDYRVGVKYQDGVAWLTGSVVSLEQKRMAERIARQSAGVDRVISKLQVVESDSAPDASVEMAGSGGEPQTIQQTAGQRQARAPQPMTGARPGNNMPVPYARSMPGGVQQAEYGYGGPQGPPQGMGGGMAPTGYNPGGMGQAVSYDNAQMPGYAWPSYAAYPNYAAVTYPQQYSPTAWPYIGPFYPYPQVPLGWRKVTLEWDDGWWNLDFKDCKDCH